MPQPPAHRVERVAGRVAETGLNLGVLVRDKVAPLQLARAQAIIECEEVERGEKRKQDEAGDEGEASEARA